mgnify:CR=1 FL=1
MPHVSTEDRPDPIAEGPTLVTPADVDGAFCRRKGNFRDMLLDLYDLHERRIRTQPQAN